MIFPTLIALCLHHKGIIETYIFPDPAAGANILIAPKISSRRFIDLIPIIPGV